MEEKVDPSEFYQQPIMIQVLFLAKVYLCLAQMSYIMDATTPFKSNAYAALMPVCVIAIIYI